MRFKAMATMTLQETLVGSRIHGQCGRMATTSGQNVLEAEKNYVVNISKTKRDRCHRYYLTEQDVRIPVSCRGRP